MLTKNPPHPGDLIKTEIIEALGLNVSEGGGDFERAPRHAFRPSARQGRADAGKWPWTSKKAFGPDMDHLLRMQLCGSPY
jgi:hypothetical protein